MKAHNGPTLKWVPVIDATRCTGCGLCVEACGPDCLDIAEGIAFLSVPSACGSEEHCIEPCRDDAIEMAWLPVHADRSVGRWQPTAGPAPERCNPRVGIVFDPGMNVHAENPRICK
jgi:NAD-dependent dihydropyrimidine dehydrogenase PreA subunit